MLGFGLWQLMGEAGLLLLGACKLSTPKARSSERTAAADILPDPAPLSPRQTHPHAQHALLQKRHQREQALRGGDAAEAGWQS